MLIMAAQVTMMVVRSCLEAIFAHSTFKEDLDAKEKGKRELLKVGIGTVVSRWLWEWALVWIK